MNSPGNAHTYRRGLPTYVVLDTSASMIPFQQLLNDTLAEIWETLITQPQVREFIHLSIISFNTVPHVVVGMTEIDALRTLPEVTCSGSTNYAPMFTLLRNCIEQDVPTLSAGGIDVLRPVVFLLTDGGPTDKSTEAWTDALAKLTDRDWRRHAHIITWGFGSTGEEILRKVATLAAFVADKRLQNREALASALSSLLRSLVSSGQRQQLQIPVTVDGFHAIDLEFTEGIR
jgi:uncharacterized protein YegL